MEDMYKAHIRPEIRSTRPYLKAETEQMRPRANYTCCKKPRPGTSVSSYIEQARTYKHEEEGENKSLLKKVIST